MKLNIFQWQSLQTRATVFTLAGFLVSIWALAFYASRMLHQDMERISGEQQFSTVSLIAAELNQELDDRLRALESVAQRITPTMMEDPAALQDFLASSPALLALFNAGNVVFDADSKAIADFPVVAGRAGVIYRQLNIVRAGLDEGKASFGKPILSKTTAPGKPIIGFGAPIRNKQGKVIGVLAGVTNLGRPNFMSHITQSRYGHSGGYMLVEPKQRLIITATDKHLVMTEVSPPGANPLTDRFIRGYEGSGISVNKLGAEILASAKVIPVTGWYVAAELPADEAFAPIHEMGQHLLLATTFLTLLAGILGWWMLRRQLAPLLATVKTLTTLSDTDQPPQPLPVARQDEIGQLIGGFNRLLETLARRGEALKESENRFRSMADCAPVMIWIAGVDKLCTYFNKGWLQFTGRSIEQETGNGWAEGVHPEDLQRCLDTYTAAFDAHREFAMEYRLRHFDGEYRWVVDNGVPRYDDRGAFMGYIGSCIDITERRRSEADLRMLYRAIEQSSASIVITDRAGKIEYVNPRFEDATGYTRSEVLGRNPRFLKSGQTQAQTYEDLWKAISEGGEWRGELCNRRKNGELFFEFAAISGVKSENGEIEHYIAVKEDITARKQADAERASIEGQLREAQKMQAIGTLAGGIAHDFNNILAIVLGNTELARQDLGADSPVLESLDEIHKASSRGRDLVQQILSFSRRQSSERKLTALAPIVEESRRLLRATLTARVTIDVHCDADVPAVLADATQIEQVLINLATNAQHAMRGGAGHIGIRLDTVMLDAAWAEAHPALRAMHARCPGRKVRLSLSDDGSGMDAAILGRIFEPFFTTKPVGEGTGLGLSVVHGIVQDHEGAIEVDSQPGRGTTFAIYLPAVEEQTNAAKPGTGAAGVTPAMCLKGGQHILYIDDDESLLLLVKRVLERRGYRISGYVNQDEALDVLRADPSRFDLVVSDYNMPGASGLDVARAVRAIRADLPLAVASGFIDEALRAQADGAGVRKLIFKADAVQDLCEAIAQLAQTLGARPNPL